MKRKKIFGFRVSETVYWIICAVLIITGLWIIIPIIKSIKKKVSKGVASRGTNDLLKENQYGDENGVRSSFVVGVADSLHTEVHSFISFETKLVELLNSLSNSQEVAYCSKYYAAQYGESLKGVVTPILSTRWNPIAWFTASKWSDLKDYVIKNLV